MKLASRVILLSIAACLMALAAIAAPPSFDLNLETTKAGSNNRGQLLQVAERVSMPAGLVAFDTAPVLSAPNSGSVFAGNLTLFKNIDPAGGYISGRALAVRPGGADGLAVLSFFETKPTTPMPANQVGWLFDAAGDGTQFYPSAVLRIGPGQSVPASTLPHFMRAYHGVPFVPFQGTKSVRVPVGHGLRFGDDVFATDGPLINEVLPEYRKIIGIIGADVVVFDKALVRKYKQGSIVAGPIPRRMTFQGLRFQTRTWGPVLVQQSCDLKFIDCTFDQATEWSSVIGCARIEFVNCTMPSGIGSSTSHDVKFRNCTIRTVRGEQGAYDFTFDGCRFGPDRVDSTIQCTGWQLNECVTNGDLFIYDAWTVKQHVAYGAVVVRGRACVVRDLWSAQPILVQALYQGMPAKASNDVLLDSIVAPSIHVEAGTSGTIRNRTCPVTGDTSQWTITPKQ